MGVQLDWQIEADRTREKVGEDPEERRKRRQRRRRIFYFIAMVAAWIAVIAGLIWYRLYTVDNQLRDGLINAAQSEAAALRIGDLGVYLSMQRSASDDWTTTETARFNDYQTLKTKTDIQITGNVIDTQIDGARGRVVLQEIVANVPYSTVWYYWHYSDGWRHVPSDYTFWGDSATITGKNSIINYQQMDSVLAQALADRVDNWWKVGCTTLNCDRTTPLGTLTITIVPDQTNQIRWQSSDDNTLIVPSPLAAAPDNRLRDDIPLPQEMEDAVASELANRLFDHTTGNLKVNDFADAAWLRQTIVNWLAARFVGRMDLSTLGFIQSLDDQYGDSGLDAILTNLTPNADISIVYSAVKQPLDQLKVDWKSFFQWRLDLEKLILQAGGTGMQNTFFALWATDSASLNHAQLRFSSIGQATPQVQSVSITAGTATIQATLNGGPVTLKFVLVGGTWKRAS